ncbi:DUF397 domain-containing protein [Actinoplanes italicus]|uniref:DUF397 domain-containing protein n=1 Tax=Actinoplanes italicus TaxID=113567 RepID=UPI000D05085D|nr:DUF397 domain-containing protein [Actinoplanes italicus]
MQSEEGVAGELAWRSSSRCNNAACVEVAFSGDSVFVRDTKDPQRRALTYKNADWRLFIAGVKSGVFDV